MPQLNPGQTSDNLSLEPEAGLENERKRLRAYHKIYEFYNIG